MFTCLFHINLPIPQSRDCFFIFLSIINVPAAREDSTRDLAVLLSNKWILELRGGSTIKLLSVVMTKLSLENLGKS